MIGISSPNFSFSPFDEMLKEVKKEFSLWEIVLELEHDLPKIEAQIKYGIDSYGMKFQAHMPIADLNIGSPSERMRRHSVDELAYLIKICNRCGISTITIHPGAAVAYGSDVKNIVRNSTRKSLIEIDPYIRDFNLAIALENMPKGDWSIGYDYAELVSLVDGTDVGICFDLGHANTTRTIDTFSSDEKGLIRNVHVHNNEGLFDQHLALDQGSIDISSVLEKLKKKYTGNYIIESKNFAEGVTSKKILEQML